MSWLCLLVVWKIDRLGRSLSHLIRIVEEIKTKGVAFRSLTEQMDTTTPHGEFLFNIFAAFADDAEHGIMRSHAPEPARSTA